MPRLQNIVVIEGSSIKPDGAKRLSEEESKEEGIKHLVELLNYVYNNCAKDGMWRNFCVSLMIHFLAAAQRMPEEESMEAMTRIFENKIPQDLLIEVLMEIVKSRVNLSEVPLPLMTDGDLLVPVEDD